MERKELIERIGYIRNRAGLSARALSMNIGKAESYINRLEQEGFEPSLTTLFDIIEACGSTPEEFFYYDISAYIEDKETLAFLKTLSEKQKRAIKNLY